MPGAELLCSPTAEAGALPGEPGACFPLLCALCPRLRLPLQSDKPFFGICLGLQLLFEGSEESGGCEGLGIVQGQVTQFDTSLGLPVPHIGAQVRGAGCRLPGACLAGQGRAGRGGLQPHWA